MKERAIKLPFKQWTKIKCKTEIKVSVIPTSGRKSSFVIKEGDILVQTTSYTNKESLFAREKTAKIGIGWMFTQEIIDKYFEVVE